MGLVAVLLLVIVQRLFELQIAQRHRTALLARGAYEVGQGHYPFFVLLHSLFFVSLVGEVTLWHRTSPAWWPFAAVMLAVAQGLRLWCIRSLGVFWNTRIIVLPGAALVKKGPYRYLRHPNYLVVIIELLVLPLLFGAYGTSLVFSLANLVLLLWVRIPMEEAALAYKKTAQ
ncbi:isoprenylcysteine carboxyl methyltransferase family protein [Heliophilum fasciatum]|nr:isoprenylcysteine carboxylmethyltransferase family protein [Heliophilum fasciatum]MCW2276681.1 methyltransferase [Heliophilum fasciatum]